MQKSRPIQQINYLTMELGELYHRAAVRLGLSDSAMCVLYALHDQGERCLLSEIYKRTDISKQTVNSAIRKLEGEGMLYLEPYCGKSKRVCLTEKGKAYVQETVARLYAAECSVFDSWQEEEIKAYIRLLEKYTEDFRKRIQSLEGERKTP